MWLPALPGPPSLSAKALSLAGLTGWHRKGNDNLLSWTLGEVYRPPSPVSSPCLFRQDSSSPPSSRPPRRSSQQQSLSPLHSAGLFSSLPSPRNWGNRVAPLSEARAQLPTTQACQQWLGASSRLWAAKHTPTRGWPSAAQRPGRPTGDPRGLRGKLPLLSASQRPGEQTGWRGTALAPPDRPPTRLSTVAEPGASSQL